MVSYDESALSHPRNIYLDNPHVRAWKRTYEPGETLQNIHFSNALIFIPLNDASLMRKGKDGTQIFVTREKGKIYWHSADGPNEFYSMQNISKTPYEAFVIELKNAE